MDLLEQEIKNNKSSSSNGKKLILMLLILCIFILVMLLVVIFALSGKQTTEDKLIVDNLQVEVKDGLIMEDEIGSKYISLEYGAELIGYKYFNGEVGNNEENKDKCYLQNENEAIGFELGSSKIYKVDLNSNIENSNYNLTKDVIRNNDKLYAELNDFAKACNLIISISQDEKQIQISTPKYLTEQYNTSLVENDKYKSVSDNYYNMKALYYGMIIVNDGQNYGVISGVISGTIKENMKTIIGARYSDIIFDEYTQDFIAKSNNKYGVISKEGKVDVEFNYDSIRIIQYSPLLYEVKQNNKFGILDETGNIIINIEYDSLGFSSSNEKSLLLIIENIDSDKKTGIIVGKNGKYGIANIKTGELILKCELEKIYSKNSENDKTTYYVQIQSKEYTLDDYIKYVNTTVVNMSS